VISGIASLFSGSSSAPAALPVYIPPAPIQISGAFAAATSGSSGVPSVYTPPVASAAPPSGDSGTAATSQSSGAQSPVPHVTVNVSAMDSQSFMDRSGDIANAVREAMLNMHPINNVIANL
jgi:hypothetical protein